MKKMITVLCVVQFIISVISFGCKTGKDDPKPTPVKTTSTWTFNGHTYKDASSFFDDANGDLLASDDASVAGGGNFVSVHFGSILRPSKSSTLTVADIDAPRNPSNCTIQVGNIYDPVYIFGHVSTGKAGDKVIVTISPAGKITASFSNITVTDGPTGTDKNTVSGTIIEH